MQRTSGATYFSPCDTPTQEGENAGIVPATDRASEGAPSRPRQRCHAYTDRVIVVAPLQTKMWP